MMESNCISKTAQRRENARRMACELIERLRDAAYYKVVKDDLEELMAHIKVVCGNANTLRRVHNGVPAGQHLVDTPPRLLLHSTLDEAVQVLDTNRLSSDRICQQRRDFAAVYWAFYDFVDGRTEEGLLDLTDDVQQMATA